VLGQIASSIGIRSAAAGREAESLRAPYLCVLFADSAEFRQAMTLADRDDYVEVCSVSFDACANLKFKVYVTPGSKLVRIGEAPVSTVAEVDKCLLDSAGDAALQQGVWFEIAPPPVPRRGYARQIARAARQNLSEAQEEFLVGLWRQDHKMTAAVMCERMVSSPLFEGKEELHLDEMEITRFLKRIYAEEKRRQKERPAGGEEDMDDLGVSAGQTAVLGGETVAEGSRRARAAAGSGETPAGRGGASRGRGRGAAGPGSEAPPTGRARGGSRPGQPGTGGPGSKAPAGRGGPSGRGRGAAGLGKPPTARGAGEGSGSGRPAARPGGGQASQQGSSLPPKRAARGASAALSDVTNAAARRKR